MCGPHGQQRDTVKKNGHPLEPLLEGNLGTANFAQPYASCQTF